jgi:hypothetical protein
VMYPIMLPGDNPEPYRQDWQSSPSNPDGLRTQYSGQSPDRIGQLYIRLLDAIEDRMSSIRFPRLRLPVRLRRKVRRFA